MHAPPINLLGAVFIPLLVFKNKRYEIMLKLSKIYYWLENFLFLIMFVVFELGLSVLVTVKINIALFMKINKSLRSILYPFIWPFISPFIMCYVVAIDTMNLFRILKQPVEI